MYSVDKLQEGLESSRIDEKGREFNGIASVSGLGHALFFPFFQPENAKFELDRSLRKMSSIATPSSDGLQDLSLNDHRLVTQILVSLAAREKSSNLRPLTRLIMCCLAARDPMWQKLDGTLDEFQMGVPRSWESAPPTGGIFKVRYAGRPGRVKPLRAVSQAALSSEMAACLSDG